MKKIKTTKFLCLAFIFLLGYQAKAQCPQGSTEVTVAYTAGSFSNENAWSLWDMTDNVELACKPSGQTGALTTVDCVTHGNTIQLRTFENFGDGWNGSTIHVATTEDGSENGCDPNMATLYGPQNPGANGNGSYFCTNSPQAGLLSFTFTIDECFTPPPGGGGGGGACSILCPPDITVTTDPYSGSVDCDAYVQIDPLEVTGDCDLQTIVNDYNGGVNASGVYPEGETTVTYTIITNGGQVIGCQFTVTVVDNTPPVFTACPGDMTINLGPGECSAVLDFAIQALDECTPVLGFLPGGPPIEITNNNIFSEASLDDALACIANPYSTLQAFNLATIGFPDPVIIESLEFIIWSAINNPTVTVNIYEYNTAIPAPNLNLNYANMTLLGTGTNNAPNFAGGAGNGLSHTVPLDVPIALAGNNIVLELITPSVASGFVAGANYDGFIQGTCYFAGCGGIYPQPVPFASLGFGIISWMAKLHGTIGLANPNASLPLIPDPGNQFNSGDAFPVGGPYCLLYTVFDDEGNSNTCDFCVTVKKFPNPTSSLACNDHVNISLDENCEAIVGADDILEGGPYTCYDDYIVRIYSNPQLTQLIPTSPLLTGSNVGQTLWVKVTAPNGNSCWGTLSVEDKIIPDLECSAYEIYCTDPTTPGYLNVIPGGVSEASVQEGGNWASTGTFANDFPIEGVGVVTDVNIALDISSTWVADLVVSITSPDGTTINVLQGACGAADNVDVLFDDDSANNFLCGGGNPVLQGTMKPQSAMTPFEGETAEGTWVVTVADNVGGDGGNINNITLTVTYSGITTEVPFPVGDDVTVIGNNQPYTLIGFDPCGPATLTYTDLHVDGDCVGDDFIKQIFRTWTAVDPSGNSTSCTDTITVLRSTIADVEFPTNKDGLEDPALVCTDDFEVDSNGHPHPNVTGWPTINGQPITNGGPCELAVSYTDQVLPVCEGTYKIIRTWTVLGWCPTTEIANDIQIIKVMDNVGPTLVCPANMVVSTGQTDCTASVILPLPTITDVCSPSTSYTVSVSQGLLVGNVLYGLPLGVTTVTITATDGCGNTSTCTFQILVQDQVPPVAICETFHVVALTIDEPTLVPALVFDDGSYDNCQLVEYKVRRMDNPACPGNDATQFGDYVPFYCCDVPGANVMVELRVRDAAGNTNSCMVEVDVQDKLSPAIQCPPNKTLDCYADPYDLNVTGVATGADNCSVVITHINQGSLDNCGEGTIFRIWTATDPGGRTASCVQTITVVNTTPFFITDTNCFNQNPNDGVIWPCDYNTNTCDPGLTPDITGEPTIIEDGCDLVGVTYEDLNLSIQDPACMKILRTWYIIDWCVYNPNTGAGSYQYTQIIKVLNSADPVITSDCEDKAFCTYDPECLEGHPTLILEATDDCTPTEDLNFYYWIDLFSDGSFEIHDQGSDASDAHLDYTNGQLDFPLGTHTIRWDVEDGCGNVATCTYQFIIADCKAPTANLLNGIAVDIMENCQIEIWANDWDNPSSPSFDNCGILEWRVQSPSQGPGQTAPPATAVPAWIFTEANIGPNTVDVWILDINGNWGYTSTYIIVQDNVPPFCNGPNGFNISGDVSTEEADMVEAVTLEIEGNNPGMPGPELTGSNGEYGFPGLPIGGNYVVTPEKDIDPLNGVTTFDLVLMSKHILQIELLPTPYKIIAADINNSGNVSAVDMVELRKLILFIDTEFQNNTSWRFVDAEFVFPNPGNPWATSFPEIFSVNGLTQDEIGNFVGIKIGDLNGSANPNSLTGNGDNRTYGELVFAIDDTEMVAGETYTVDFTAKDFNGILGYQYTFAFDKNAVEFLNVQAGELTNLDDSNFGMTMLNDGIITASWNNTDAVTLENDAVLFSMTFVAKSNAQLSDVISLNSRYTKAEGYNSNLDLLDIALEFNGSAVSGDFDLYQNQPNPFKDETVIGFNLPEATFAKLTVYDVSGKVLRVVEGEYSKGYNEVSLNRSQLAGTGVLYYQLDTDTNSATKKMILIK